MSINNFGKKAINWVLLVIFVSLMISFWRQIITYRNLKRELEARQEEFEKLKKENEKLTKIREAIERGEFFVAPDKTWQAKDREVFSVELPNYKKWEKLLRKIF